MAALTISEYAECAVGANGLAIPSVPLEPNLAFQKITIGAASVASASFQGRTRMVRLHAEAACCVLFGGAKDADPTATNANATLFAAGETRDYGVVPGARLAVIQP